MWNFNRLPKTLRLFPETGLICKITIIFDANHAKSRETDEKME